MLRYPRRRGTSRKPLDTSFAEGADVSIQGRLRILDPGDRIMHAYGIEMD